MLQIRGRQIMQTQGGRIKEKTVCVCVGGGGGGVNATKGDMASQPREPIG